MTCPPSLSAIQLKVIMVRMVGEIREEDAQEASLDIYDLTKTSNIMTQLLPVGKEARMDRFCIPESGNWNFAYTKFVKSLLRNGVLQNPKDDTVNGQSVIEFDYVSEMSPEKTRKWVFRVTLDQAVQMFDHTLNLHENDRERNQILENGEREMGDPRVVRYIAGHSQYIEKDPKVLSLFNVALRKELLQVAREHGDVLSQIKLMLLDGKATEAEEMAIAYNANDERNSIFVYDDDDAIERVSEAYRALAQFWYTTSGTGVIEKIEQFIRKLPKENYDEGDIQEVFIEAVYQYAVDTGNFSDDELKLIKKIVAPERSDKILRMLVERMAMRGNTQSATAFLGDIQDDNIKRLATQDVEDYKTEKRTVVRLPDSGQRLSVASIDAEVEKLRRAITENNFDLVEGSMGMLIDHSNSAPLSRASLPHHSGTPPEDSQ